MYRSLEYLPHKLFLEITNTNEFHLLSGHFKTVEDYTEDELSAFARHWEKLLLDYERLDKDSDADKIIKIQREVAHFKAKYKLIQTYCAILRFDWHDETAEAVKEYGYRLRDDHNYESDIDAIEKQAEGLLVKAEKMEMMLPKQEESESKEQVHIDIVYASYVSILGVNFDFNTASVTEIIGYQRAISEKIKAWENQNKKD